MLDYKDVITGICEYYNTNTSIKCFVFNEIYNQPPSDINDDVIGINSDGPVFQGSPSYYQDDSDQTWERWNCPLDLMVYIQGPNASYNQQYFYLILQKYLHDNWLNKAALRYYDPFRNITKTLNNSQYIQCFYAKPSLLIILDLSYGEGSVKEIQGTLQGYNKAGDLVTSNTFEVLEDA